MSPSQGQTFAACVGSRLAGLEFRRLCDNDSDSFLGAFLEYGVLDDKATLWFFHYIRCYTLCDVATNDMVCTSALSVDVARDAQTSRWSGHK